MNHKRVEQIWRQAGLLDGETLYTLQEAQLPVGRDPECREGGPLRGVFAIVLAREILAG